ncbi:MAG: hypothetical protein HN509_07270 [Halobacteriovoraceae bacterium]|jgi:hypothetical protein|nr:hypothetical protein [Halobacteriovoraceae bacterium]MBT5095471.1 hypothetical protein [Halobacteriovoraceae bacterium]
MRQIIIGIIALSLGQTAFGNSSQCFPDSKQRYPIQKNKALHMGETEFHSLLKRFKETFSDYVKIRAGKILKIEAKWKEERVNAHCTRDMQDNPVIVFNGGMARHPEMSRDGILLILCHELGHYMGGAPKAFRGRSQRRSWSSAEGQADYFASTKCLPLLFGDGKDLYDYNFIKAADDKSNCLSDQCLRISLAGLSVARVFASLKKSRMPTIGNFEGVEVRNTNHSHASPQCRLDTFLAGAICDQDPLGSFDDSDPQVSACVRSTNLMNDPKGARPLCWYNPENF